jgi:hypothetical protein
MVSDDKRAADFLSKMEIRVEKLRAQLAEAEIVVITGVVHPPGAGGSRMSRGSDGSVAEVTFPALGNARAPHEDPADWELLVSLAYWRPAGGEVRESKLTLRKPVSRAALDAAFERVRPYDLLQAKVRLVEHWVIDDDLAHTGSPQGLLVEIAPDRPHDPELERLTHHLREAVIMRDERFGEFILNRRIDWFEAKTKWGGTPVNLALSGSGADEVAEALATAHALWDAQEAWHQRIVAHAVQRLLPVKNENWLEAGEKPLTAADFVGRTSLTDITIYEGGTFEFWFNDCDLFSDHSICVSGDLQNGPKQSDIEG